MNLGIYYDHRVMLNISNESEERKPTKVKRREKRSFGNLGSGTKPEVIKWLHLTPRVAALEKDAFEQSPPMIAKIDVYISKELNLAEAEG